MLAFPNVLYLFAHEFTRLGGRRFALAFVLTRPFNWFFCAFNWLFFWHTN